MFLLVGCNSDEKTLFKAIESGDLSTVEQIVNKGEDIHLFEYEGMNPFTKAAHEGQLELVEYLHEKVNFSLNKKDANEKTALNYAESAGRKDVVRYLKETQESLNEDFSDILEEFYDELDDPSSSGKLVVWEQYKGHILNIIEKGADVNLEDSDGYTPLLTAIEEDNKKMLKLLIRAGADVNAKGKYNEENGITALMMAIDKENKGIEKLLIEAGADINTKSENGITALRIAAYVENEDMVKLLIEAGADVNAKDNDNFTALMIAAYVKNEDIVKLLIEAGADVNAKNNDGGTALSYATIWGDTEVADLLRAAGAVE